MVYITGERQPALTHLIPVAGVVRLLAVNERRVSGVVGDVRSKSSVVEEYHPVVGGRSATGQQHDDSIRRKGPELQLDAEQVGELRQSLLVGVEQVPEAVQRDGGRHSRSCGGERMRRPSTADWLRLFRQN